MRRKFLLFTGLLSSFALWFVFQGYLFGQEDDVVNLSPFLIEADEGVGYQATSTLAGTRLRTDLRDLGSAISVMTQEIFEDTGATDAQTILSYGLNTEVSGVYGNFADGLGNTATGRAEQDEQRLNPQSSQRIRGLAQASLTRNFFLTDIPFDSYNTDRVDISRGANSLLFGIGAPGGVINNSLSQATVDGRDFGEISVRLGERESHRESFDLHKVLINGRLAVRIAGLYDDAQYKQRPAYEVKERFYGAFEGVLLENKESDFLGRTVIRGNFEVGTSKGNPPNIVPPGDSFTSFFELPDASIANVPGLVLPSYHPDSGVPVEGSRYHPEIGLTAWAPKLTLDNRTGIVDTTVPTLAQRPLSFMVGTVQPQPNSGDYDTGFSLSPGIQAFQGQAVGAAKALFEAGLGGDALVSNNFAFLISQSFFGGNRQGQMVPNFVVPVIMDKNVWDNDNHLFQGTTNHRKTNFDTYNITLEQTMLNGNAGVEISYDKQKYEQRARIPFSAGETIGDTSSGDIVIDISEYQMDGSPNPNVGRPMVSGRRQPEEYYNRTDRESFRATGFFKFDFRDMVADDSWLRWLGSHTITGFYNEQEIEDTNIRTTGAWSSDEVVLGDSSGYDLGGNLSSGRRDVLSFVYVGPTVLGMNSPSEVQLSPLELDLPDYGDYFTASIYNRGTSQLDVVDLKINKVYDAGSIRKQVLDTKVLSWQGRFLNDHIVGLFGRREDKTKTFENITDDNEFGIPRDFPDNTINPESIRLQNDPSNPAEGTTDTWSIVAHVPQDWLGELPFTLSGHVSSSENFQPSGTRRNILGGVLPFPSGTTDEKGFTIGMFDGKLTARFNWFETKSTGATADVGAGSVFGRISSWVSDAEETRDNYPDVYDGLIAAGASDAVASAFASYEDMFDEIISWVPDQMQAVRNLRYNRTTQELESESNPGEVATQDFVSKGFELDLVANPSRNWRLAMNVAQQESIQDNTAVALGIAASEALASIQASPLGNLQDAPVRGVNLTYAERFNGQILPAIRNIAARNGTIARELREWRVNFLTTYNFTEGALNGFGVGGGVRYQSRNAVGNPNVYLPDSSTEVVPDVSSPFYGPGQFNGDLWLSYRAAITDKIDWKIQLNARNAFGDNDPIPVVINPDGRLSVVRNANPREVFLTNTFSF